MQTIVTEIGIRFGEVSQHLDRLDATLVEHGKQVAAGARALAELSELKLRVEKLERTN